MNIKKNKPNNIDCNAELTDLMILVGYNKLFISCFCFLGCQNIHNILPCDLHYQSEQIASQKTNT